MSNPQRVDLTERKFVGIPRRAAIIIGLSIAAGFLLILGLPLNLLGRLVVGVGVALGGLSLAFLKVDGLNPEAWLLESLSFRRRVRYRIKGFRQAAPEPVRTQTQAPAQPKPAARIAAPRASAAAGGADIRRSARGPALGTGHALLRARAHGPGRVSTRGRGRARGDSAPHPERQIQRGRHAPRRCPQPGRRLLHPSCPASGAGR